MNPILGVTDGISSVAEGLTKQMNISSAVGIGLVRPPRAFERSSVDTEDLILVPIDVYKSYAQFLVFRAAEEIKKKDYYLCMAYLGFTPAKGTRSIPYSILLSERFIRLLSSALEIIWEYPYGDISHATINQQDPSTVVIIRYEQSSSKAVSERSKINIGCQNVKAAIQVYSVIYRNSYRLGNASLMESIDSVKARLLESDSLSYEEMLDKKVPKMDPNSSYTGLSYVMGTANKLKVKPEKMQSEKFWSWAQLQLASQPGYDELIKTGLTPNLADHQYLQMIDEKLWRVVQTWSRNHSTFKLSRCCACLIFNHSSHAVQILDVSIKEGRDVHLFGVGKHGYDADARLIAKENGAVVVFGVANTPNLVQKGHIKININSTAFSIQVSTRKSGGEAEGNEAYTISFLEKSITEWWAKYAIIIK